MTVRLSELLSQLIDTGVNAEDIILECLVQLTIGLVTSDTILSTISAILDMSR